MLDELDGYAQLIDDETGAQVACNERIWQSDSLIPKDLHDGLLRSVAKLEDVPADKQDWHPGSNGQVLDLVHPSLYPVCYGSTVARNAEGTLEVVKAPGDVQDHSNFLSKRFQWLPSDFDIDSSGKAHLQGYYINNIHPSRNADLYPVIERLVERAVPMFERVLSDLRRPLSKQRMRVDGNDVYHRYQGKVGCVFVDEDGRSSGPAYPPDDINCGSWETEEFEAWYKTLPLRLPEVYGPYDGALDRIRKTVSLTGSTVQLIVKLANIILTPDKPGYPGGSWHVEGT